MPRNEPELLDTQHRIDYCEDFIESERAYLQDAIKEKSELIEAQNIALKSEIERKEADRKLQESEAKRKESDRKLQESEAKRKEADRKLQESEAKRKESERKLQESEAKRKEADRQIQELKKQKSELELPRTEQSAAKQIKILHSVSQLYINTFTSIPAIFIQLSSTSLKTNKHFRFIRLNSIKIINLPAIQMAYITAIFINSLTTMQLELAKGDNERNNEAQRT